VITPRKKARCRRDTGPWKGTKRRHERNGSYGGRFAADSENPVTVQPVSVLRSCIELSCK